MRYNHRIGVMMCAFREEKLVIPAIKQFDGTEIEEIVVACSRTPWNGEFDHDDTAKLAVEAGATVRLYDWKEEHEQKNWILDKLSRFDWILMFAPDMYMTKESINNLTYFLNGKPMDKHERAYSCDMLTYWKNYHTVLEPRVPFNTVAIRPTEVFKNMATIDNWDLFKRIEGVLMHHISWVKTDDDVIKKINTYSHAKEIVVDWFKEVWLKWDESMTNFGPTVKTDYKGVSSFKLPTEIVKLLKDNNAYYESEN